MNLPEAIMAALPLKDDGQLIVVGDHRQMRPILEHDWAGELPRTFQEFRAYESLFRTFLQGSAEDPVRGELPAPRLHGRVPASRDPCQGQHRLPLASPRDVAAA
jgi:hypothetical protein